MSMTKDSGDVVVNLQTQTDNENQYSIIVAHVHLNNIHYIHNIPSFYLNVYKHCDASGKSSVQITGDQIIEVLLYFIIVLCLCALFIMQVCHYSHFSVN